MSTPALHLALDDSRRAYRPGETLAGEYRVEALSGGELQALEISVLWSTEGKGDEDMAVHFFDRIADDQPVLAVTERPGLAQGDEPIGECAATDVFGERDVGECAQRDLVGTRRKGCEIVAITACREGLRVVRRRRN